jgi:hypothetical protein
MEVHGLTERRLMTERLERSETHFRDQHPRRHADGHYAWLESAGTPLLNEK